MGKKKALTQAEIWDDSELVKSWNEAYEEYKKYHSLAVKGERINIEAESNDMETTTNIETGKSIPTKSDAHGQQSIDKPAPAAIENKTKVPESQSTVPAQTNGMNVPQTLLNSVQDEDVKNLMMSWYYAGYYTGLYEGKQQAYASMQQQQEGE